MILRLSKIYAGCEYTMVIVVANYLKLMKMNRLTPNQIQKLLNQYLVADYEQPINGDIMRAVASRVTEKNDVLLLQTVDMDDSGPYDIAEPRQITALETYTPSWLPCHRLRRIADIVAAQAHMHQSREVQQEVTGLGIEQDGETPPPPFSPAEEGNPKRRSVSLIPKPVEGTTRSASHVQQSDGLPAINE